MCYRECVLEGTPLSRLLLLMKLHTHVQRQILTTKAYRLPISVSRPRGRSFFGEVRSAYGGLVLFQDLLLGLQ